METIIGVDEAGRGPVIGPLVVAGVKFVSESQIEVLENLKVRDSKKCTPTRREKLAVEIKKTCDFSIKTISATEIDEQRKLKTLNVLEGELFAEVIKTFSPKPGWVVYVDSADASEETFKLYIESKLKSKPTIISKHKADELYLVVSAASILAKTERDAQVRAIAHELNMDIGSGYPSDPVTCNFLEKWIKDKGDLPPYTRRSWNTVKRLLSNKKTTVKTLDRFTD